VLTIGRHLLTQDGARTWLLAAPGRLPDPPRAWGVTAPLAGLRTARQGGVGDYTDLARAALATAQAGAAFFGINPVHAGFPSDPKAFSPYTPSHRQWLNTLHIATDAAPASRGALIDYAAETRRQFAALRADYAAFQDAGAFDAFETYRAAMGDALQRFATHQALSGEHGPYWNDWPKGLRRADAPDVAQATVALADDIRFHAWAQWRAETQLARVADDLNAAGMRFGLYLDLAVGTHPHGAETWENPGLFAQGAALGAPPDAFAPDGQNWNLAPMVPHVLADEGFATLAAILRRQFQFARLLRIDHILGFERAFWATGDAGVPGAYVKMPLDAMLAVTRIEAARAGATVIGEDLGNIPAGLQSALKSSGLLGCRVVAFEQDVAGGNGFRPATQYDPQTLASFSTHDLPTWRGWRKGADIAAHSRLGHIDTPQRARALATRKAETAAFDALTDTRGMHGFLADCGSGLVAVQIENVLDVEDQPNLPGTIDEYPNWRQRLPVAIADYLSDDRLMHIASIMNSQERRNRP
jgi:4-alpha-glucanotransferase